MHLARDEFQYRSTSVIYAKRPRGGPEAGAVKVFQECVAAGVHRPARRRTVSPTLTLALRLPPRGTSSASERGSQLATPEA